MAEDSDRRDEKLEELIEKKVEERLQQQKKRIDELEEENKELRESIAEKASSTSNLNEQNMSRRQFLKKAGLGAAGLGAMGLAPATSQLKLTKNGIFSSTQTEFSQNINLKGNNINKGGTISVDSINAKRVGAGAYHYAGDYSGSDPDTRLDNCLSTMSAGETVYLEPASYTSNRTFSVDGINIFGTGWDEGTNQNATWTFDSNGDASGRAVRGGWAANGNTINVDDYETIYKDIRNGSFQVSESKCVFTNLIRGSVTFESGTNGNIVDSSTNVSYTDNDGSNTKGNIG